jgi:hypothetical protein
MSRRSPAIGVLCGLSGLCGLAAAGLSGCLDTLGHEEDTTQSRVSQGLTRIDDDQIADKHPTFDPARTITETLGPQYGSCAITLNKSATVTKLDIVPFEPPEAALDGKLFRGRTEALAAIASMGSADALPSMEVVNGALKPFNDGLYAAVELQAENEKRPLLMALAARLGESLATATASTRPAFEEATVLVGAALILGGDTPALPAALQSRAQARVAAFNSMPGFARPIGFYTWTPALERIFTRDRLLQNGDGGDGFGAFAALAFVLGQDAALLADYQHVTALYSGLTNPYVSYPIDALIPYVPSADALGDVAAINAAFAAANPARKTCNGTLVAFLPASRSKETEYFDTRFCDGVPDGTNLLDVLIQAIQSGAVDLAPATDAGWYDYQLYALETLLLPERGLESQHLLLTAGYKKKLIETFKSLLIQNRETHVKQLGGFANRGSAEFSPVDLYPLLPVEPFPTFYLRTARGYRFLRTFLEATLGADFLAGNERLVETGGRAAATLAAELDQRIALLYGLSFAGADAVGMARGDGLLADELAGIDADAAVTTARAWLETWKTDPDVARDPRVIVPIAASSDDTTTYWAVIGVKALAARAEFVAGHEPVVTPTACWTGNMVPHRYTLLVEDTAELRLPSGRPPPTRDELRAVCNAHATKAEIVQALGSQ